MESSGITRGGSNVEGGAAAAVAADPTRAQLRTLFMHSAVPMVGFGESGVFDDALKMLLKKAPHLKKRHEYVYAPLSTL